MVRKKMKMKTATIKIELTAIVPEHASKELICVNLINEMMKITTNAVVVKEIEYCKVTKLDENSN